MEFPYYFAVLPFLDPVALSLSVMVGSKGSQTSMTREMHYLARYIGEFVLFDIYVRVHMSKVCTLNPFALSLVGLDRNADELYSGKANCRVLTFKVSNF